MQKKGHVAVLFPFKKDDLYSRVPPSDSMTFFLLALVNFLILDLLYGTNDSDGKGEEKWTTTRDNW